MKKFTSITFTIILCLTLFLTACNSGGVKNSSSSCSRVSSSQSISSSSAFTSQSSTSSSSFNEKTSSSKQSSSSSSSQSSSSVISSSQTISSSQSQTIPEYDISNRVALDNGEIKYIAPQVETYYNYIEVFDDKGRVYTVGDPYVLKYNGLYYLYVSCSVHYTRVGIPCWTSTNLVDWSFRAWVYGDGETNMGDYTNNSNISFNAYAPEVIYYNGWFYMCQSVNGQGHYILKCATPDGKFEVCSQNLGLGIDGNFYVSSSGELYMFFAWDNAIKYIKLKIDNGNVLVDGDFSIVSTAYLGAWTEGPATIERNGYKYLLYTGNHVNAADYRLAYSYTTAPEVFNELKTVNDNILLINTGDDTPYNKMGYNSKQENYQNVSTYRGVGHGSMHYGPNLDSVYLSYHSQGRNDHTGANPNGGFDRRYNLTQMYTNNAYLTTNGISIHDTPKPTMADYYTSTLNSEGDFNLTQDSALAVYTAEINVKLKGGKASVVVGYLDQQNYTQIEINGQELVVNRYIGGQKEVLGSANINLSQNDNYHAIKIINGYSASTVLYDNVKVLSLQKALSSSGKVGVCKGYENGVVSFTNDAYGTSDFEAIKNLTTTFPAHSYLKGENRGFSIKDATVKVGGLRQGEKEISSTYAGIENADGAHGSANYITLNQGDWVKYAINAPEAGTYSFNVEVNKASLGCVFEVIIDETYIYKMEIKDTDFYSKKVFVVTNAGAFDVATKGVHSLKVRVYSGTLNMMSVSTQKNAGQLVVSEDLLQGFNSGVKVIGNASFNNGLVCSAEGKTLYYVGNKGATNFTYSIDVDLNGDKAGLIFRAKNFSHTTLDNVINEALQGYFVEITANSLAVFKYNYIGGDYFLNAFSGDFSSKANVKITAVQNVIKFYVNNSYVGCIYDDYAYMDGYCGIYCKNNSKAVFTNLYYATI